jgi:hypothetical protein
VRLYGDTLAVTRKQERSGRQREPRSRGPLRRPGRLKRSLRDARRLGSDGLPLRNVQTAASVALRKFDQIDVSANQPLAMLASTKHARGRAGGGIRV